MTSFQHWMPINIYMNSHSQTHPAEKKNILFKSRQLHKLVRVLLCTHPALPNKLKGNGICVGLQKGLLRALQNWFPGPATRLQVLLLRALLVFRQCKSEVVAAPGYSLPSAYFPMVNTTPRHCLHRNKHVPVCTFLIYQTALCIWSFTTTLPLRYSPLLWGTSLKTSKTNSCCQKIFQDISSPIKFNTVLCKNRFQVADTAT